MREASEKRTTASVASAGDLDLEPVRLRVDEAERLHPGDEARRRKNIGAVSDVPPSAPTPLRRRGGRTAIAASCQYRASFPQSAAPHEAGSSAPIPPARQFRSGRFAAGSSRPGEPASAAHVLEPDRPSEPVERAVERILERAERRTPGSRWNAFTTRARGPPGFVSACPTIRSRHRKGKHVVAARRLRALVDLDHVLETRGL